MTSFRKIVVVSLFALNTFIASAQDVVKIYEEELGICASNTVEVKHDVCKSNAAEFTTAKGQIFFYKTNTGRIDSGEELEVVTTLDLKFTHNSIGNPTYQMKDDAGVELDSNTYVGFLFKVTNHGYEDYYIQAIRSKAFGIESDTKTMLFSSNDVNLNSFVTDATKLIGRAYKTDSMNSWIPKEYGVRYMQVHHLLPFSIGMKKLNPANSSSTQKFNLLHK
ncbi:MAG: hypothetical protein KC646_02305 [Candidatus Cloacimonetes bacterium]|nr:hypothetical protein [Candidatus Cloacimonadota bacterium]